MTGIVVGDVAACFQGKSANPLDLEIKPDALKSFLTTLIVQGSAGPQGATGAQGAAGAQGAQGPQGSTGAQGTQGAHG